PMLQNVINLGPQQRAPMGPAMPGQSMMRPDGSMGPGDAAVSWLQNPGQQMPGGMQAMPFGAHQMAGPGMPGMSQMAQGPAGPGAAARSLLDGTVQGPGGPAQSMMTGQHMAAPG